MARETRSRKISRRLLGVRGVSNTSAATLVAFLAIAVA